MAIFDVYMTLHSCKKSSLIRESQIKTQTPFLVSLSCRVLHLYTNKLDVT